MSRRVVTIRKNDAHKGDMVDNFRLIGLQYADFEICAKMLTMILTLVVCRLVRDALSPTNLSTTIFTSRDTSM